MPQVHRPKYCEPGKGCFECPYDDCRYSGKRSKSENTMCSGYIKETEGHGYMPPTHQGSGHVRTDRRSK